MKTKFFFGAVILAVTVSIPVSAETDSAEVIVTATRTSQSIAQTLSSATVVSAADIERYQPTDLLDLFQHVPGIDLARNGGAGSVPSLFIRGSNTGHALFLIDGQRFNSASLGSTSFQFIDPSQIERIEIVRGAKSSIYGSDAIGGVIQIFTKKGDFKPSTMISTEVGSNVLKRTAISTRGAYNQLRYSLDASYLETDGIDAQLEDREQTRDNDGYRNRSINANFGYTFDNGVDVGLGILEANSRSYYDNASDGSRGTDPYSDNTIQNIGFNISAPLTDWWQSKISIGRSMDDIDDTNAVDGSHLSNFRTTKDQYSWQNDIEIFDGQLVTFGVDLYDDELIASTTYTDTQGALVKERMNRAYFAQYQGKFSIFDYVLGFREDDNEETGKQDTSNVALGAQLGKSHRVTISWAEGFKAPTFNDLYWPIGAYAAGNPDLLPEDSEIFELGARGDYSLWKWEASIYQNRIDNLIEWAPSGSEEYPYQWVPSNVSSAKIKGGEFSADTNIGGWDITTSFSYTDPRNQKTDKMLQKRAKKKFTFDIDRSFSRLDAGLSFNATSKRYTNTTNTANLGGYGLLDFRLSYHLAEKIKMQLKANNVFDKHYRTASESYHMDGSNWVLKFTYTL
ncbi:MAG: TonB-dependent receptor [Porticoccus sp.]